MPVDTTGEKFVLGALTGCIGGACSTFAGQPFDTVKVRMQTCGDGRPSFCRIFMSTFRQEGVRGLYHGTTPALALNLLEKSIIFAVNEQLKRHLMKRQNTEKLPVSQLAFCGGVSGLVHCVFSCPAEVIKTRLQVVGSTSRGPLQCIQSTIATKGISGLYLGCTPFVLREVPLYLSFLVTYELVCNELQRMGAVPRKRNELSALEIMGAGGIAGIVGWSGVVPMDTAMVRMQSGKGVGSGCSSLSQTMGMIYRIEGWRGFFPGLVPAMLRAFVANCALGAGFEGSRRLLKPLFGN